MSEHELVRELLALAAAGALSADEERRLRVHIASCAGCAAELRTFQALAGELDALPIPQAPADLVARTRGRLEAVLKAEADRRWEEIVLVFLSLLAWTVGLSTWAVWRVVTAGPAGLTDFSLTQSLTYLTVSTLLAWLTAGVAAAVAGRRRQTAWRSI